MKKKKVIVIGEGFISSLLNHDVVSHKVYPDHTSIKTFIDIYKPDVIVNCAGFCGGSNIDGCELDKKRTFDSNTILPILLATECEKRDIRFIHIGSGCIYYGPSINTTSKFTDNGWKENDPTTPLSTYSRSKYAADLALETLKNTTILRIRMPISHKKSTRNLISKLIKYKQVVEAPNSMTFITDLSRSVDFSIDREKLGIYHIVNSKPLTHSQILKEYQKYVPEHQFTSITPKELDGLVSAKRSNCILDNTKAIEAGFTFQDTQEALEESVRRYATEES